MCVYIYMIQKQQTSPYVFSRKCWPPWVFSGWETPTGRMYSWQVGNSEFCAAIVLIPLQVLEAEWDHLNHLVLVTKRRDWFFHVSLASWRNKHEQYHLTFTRLWKFNDVCLGIVLRIFFVHAPRLVVHPPPWVLVKTPRFHGQMRCTFRWSARRSTFSVQFLGTIWGRTQGRGMRRDW